MDCCEALFPSVKLECLKNYREDGISHKSHMGNVLQLFHYVKGTVLCDFCFKCIAHIQRD